MKGIAAASATTTLRCSDRSISDRPFARDAKGREWNVHEGNVILGELRYIETRASRSGTHIRQVHAWSQGEQSSDLLCLPAVLRWCRHSHNRRLRSRSRIALEHASSADVPRRQAIFRRSGVSAMIGEPFQKKLRRKAAAASERPTILFVAWR